jgi:inactivated superfamily I helicase
MNRLANLALAANLLLLGGCEREARVDTSSDATVKRSLTAIRGEVSSEDWAKIQQVLTAEAFRSIGEPKPEAHRVLKDLHGMTAADLLMRRDQAKEQRDAANAEEIAKLEAEIAKIEAMPSEPGEDFEARRRKSVEILRTAIRESAAK